MAKKSSLCILLTLCLLSCVRMPQRGGEGVAVTTPVLEIAEEFDKSDSLRVNYLYTEGVKVLTMEDDISLALPYFERVLAIDSLHSATHYQVGTILFERDPQEALPHLEIAYAADPKNEEYVRSLSTTTLALGDYRRARGLFEQLVELEPKNYEAYYYVARLSAVLNECDKGIEALNLAERRIGRDEGLAKIRRMLYGEMERFGEALADAQISAMLHPNDPEIHLELGRLYAILRRYKDSESALLQALSLKPNNPETHLLLIGVYDASHQDGKMLEATKKAFLLDGISTVEKRDLYERCIEERGEEFLQKNFFAIYSILEALYMKHEFPFVNDPETSMLYVRHKLRSGEQERALELLYMLCEQRVSLGKVYYWTAEMEFRNGNLDKALTVLDWGTEATGDWKLYTNKAYLLLEADKPLKDIEKVLKKGIKEAPTAKSKSDLYTTLADIQEEPKKMYAYYEKALEYNPENISALNNWAYLLSENGGDLEEALRMSTKACELAPTNANNLDTKAWILFRMGRVKEAKGIMRQAISLDSSGDGTFLLHYGDILTVLGEYFMAEHYYKRALEAGEDEEVVARHLKAMNELKERE